jgi:hypothetical protein
VTCPRRSAASARSRPWSGVATSAWANGLVLKDTVPVDRRLPRLSTAVARSRCVPAETSSGSRSNLYGAVVSEPRGVPSSTKVTATIRPERALAAAFSVVGLPTEPGGRASDTEGGPAAVEERSEPVARE